jgi:hypothetical protein
MALLRAHECLYPDREMVASSRLERILNVDPEADLTRLPIEEIRSLRSECQELEVDQSYLRRLVQGRLDIVAAELRHRVEGGERADLSQLVSELPEILGDHVHAPGPGRLPTFLAPSDPSSLVAEVDAVVNVDQLCSLPDMADTDVRDLIDRLTELERAVSARRRALHERIDSLQAELTRRYKTGEASVESLLS